MSVTKEKIAKAKEKLTNGFEKKIITNVIDAAKLKEGDICVYDDDAQEIRFGSKILHIRSMTDNDKFTMVGPGSYTLAGEDYRVVLKRFKPSYDKTASDFFAPALNVLSLIQTFLEKTDVFKEIGIKPRRGILLYGPPGTGKTYSLLKTIEELTNEETVSIYVRTDAFNSRDIVRLFQTHRPNYKVKRVFLVIEDLGGAEVNTSSAGMHVDSSTLALLDGTHLPWEIPTVTFSTTNYPETMLPNIIDRPGRFDEVIKIGFPEKKEVVNYMQHLLKRELTEAESSALRSKNDLSIAHVKELCVKHLVYDSSIPELIAKIREHKKKIDKAFEESKSMGIGIDD